MTLSPQLQSAEQKLRERVLEEFSKRRLRNARYSLRSLARDLNVSHSVLSEVFNAKRPLRAKTAQKLVEGLGLDPLEAAQFLPSIPSTSRSALKAGADFEHKDLSVENFHVLSSSIHFAILSLSETKTFKSDVKWIARRLGRGVQETQKALDRLEALDLLVRDKKTNVLKNTGEKFRLMLRPEEAHTAFRNSHRESLQLAEAALATVPTSERAYSSSTFCVSPEHLDELRGLMEEFRARVSSLAERRPKKEVYRLNIQFFPLSQNERTLS